MKNTLAVVTVLLVAASAFAQSDPVLTSARQVLERQARNLVAAAELMPADKYGFKPTEAQMTFAHLVHHTAEANNLLCARVAGDEPPAVAAKEDAGKDALVAALRQSFEYCTAALGRARDAGLGEETPLFGGRRGPRASALLSLTGTWASHYSIAAVYLRLNDILPPTARPAQ
jgi:hypothetical protein